MYLKSYDIPYRVYGGTSFFQRAEVKDILAYLRLMHNPNDDVAFLRIVNVPRRGIGDAAVSALAEHAAANGLPLFPALMTLPADALPRYRAKLMAFCEIIQSVYRELGNRSLADVTELLLDAICYDAYLREDKKENYEIRADIVNELIGYIREFTAGVNEAETDPLQSFLETVALFSQADDVDGQNGRVALMTLHSAKGLEFPIVFLTGLEEGLFPSSQSSFEPEKLEEERRLCYVGITRAMEQLHVSYARSRMMYGKINPGMPSVFLRELGDALPQQSRPQPRRAPAARPAFSQTAPMHTLTPQERRKQPVPRIRLGEQPQSAAAESNVSGLCEGMRIAHNTFGNGTVLSVSGAGNSQIVEIAFDSGANKKFAAAYAPITKLEDSPA